MIDDCSIVVSPKDTFSTLGPCLAALVPQLPPQLDVFAVVGGAPEALVRAWRRRFEPRVRFVVERELLLQARARNIGLSLARTARCVLMDGDVFGRPGWLSRLASAQEETGAVMVVPTVLERPRRVHCIGNDLYVSHSGGKARGHKVLRFHRHPFDDRVSVPRSPVDYGELHCQLVAVEPVVRLGGFDERVLHEVEIDVGLALRRAGLSLLCDPGAVVHFLEDAPLRAEDIPLYRWKWDHAGALAGQRRFEEKWGIDISEHGHYRRFVDMRAARLGLLPRALPCAAALEASRWVSAAASRAGRLWRLPAELLDALGKRARGYGVWPDEVHVDGRRHPALEEDWRAAGAPGSRRAA